MVNLCSILGQCIIPRVRLRKMGLILIPLLEFRKRRCMSQSDYFSRPPRIQPEMPVGEVEIPNPPTASSNMGQLGLLSVFVPLVTILGYSLIATRGGRMIFILPMGLAAVLTSTVGFLNWKRHQENERRKQENYELTLKNLREQMIEAHEQQRQVHTHNAPDPRSLLKMVETLDPRLWERRATDPDFGAIRLGLGKLPSSVAFKAPSANNFDAPLLPHALKLARDYAFVQNVPITLSLRQAHTMGIIGKDHAAALDFARSILVHLAALHAPTDVRLFVIGDSSAANQWNWARWLPHCTTSREQQNLGEQVCFTPSEFPKFWSQLQDELERREVKRKAGNAPTVAHPLLVVLVDMFQTGDAASPIQEVVAETAMNTLLNYGKELGAAALFLVPKTEAVPSECKAVLRVESGEQATYFSYAETGTNSMRYHGIIDRIDIRAADQFSRRLAPLYVRTTYGSNLPLTLSLLDLEGSEILETDHILQRWRESRQRTTGWPAVTLGRSSGNKPRTLVFSTDHDGVHGLVAGTTGTGKSELLMSLIIGLAARYDPTIVNFVLVDYKGGTAFEAFRRMPHTVDVITNLQGYAGVRMFTAVRAELNRRSQLITDAGVKDIVEYRQYGFHERTPLPHLFIIIDEFAEMIRERPEFRGQIDSIARLGRALGVHLILATQRPSGVVSDQIRANMKFRICLRVETVDDSRELLNRADAAFLPPNIPGRAYLQVGNEGVDLIQVARVGGVYQGPKVQTEQPIVWLNRQQKAAAAQATEPAATETLASVLVRLMCQVADENDEVVKLTKPWPDPLPDYLALRSLVPAVDDWIDKQGRWYGADWTQPVFRAPIGLLDNMNQAEQPRLNVDLAAGHSAVIGASGWGKTSLLRSIVTALAATYSPAELNIYCLDFGGRGLAVFEHLPHVGAIITPTEPERVQRLFRKLETLVEARKLLFSQAQVSNIAEYNARTGNEELPALLLLVENFAEFRENFDDELNNLASLLREARAYGVYVVITADQVSSIPPKIYGMFTERLALRLADTAEYASVVGRSVEELPEVPGRGYVYRERQALQFQAALAHGTHISEAGLSTDDNAWLTELAWHMNEVWAGPRPEPIEILRSNVGLRSILAAADSTSVAAVLGLSDLDLKPFFIDLKTRGPHFAIIGPPLSGKTTALRSWVLALASCYEPRQVAMILVDFQTRFFRYGGSKDLGSLPHIAATVSDSEQLEKVMESLRVKMEERAVAGLAANIEPEIFVFMDNYDDLAGNMSNRTLSRDLAQLARRYGADGLHFVVAGSTTVGRGGDDLIRQIMMSRYGIGLDNSDAPLALGARLRSGASVQEFPPGRGFLVRSGQPSLVQVATPQHAEQDIEASLDNWVADLSSRYPTLADDWLNTVEPQ